MKRFRELIKDNTFQRKLNGWLTVFWFAVAFPICIFLSSSVPFLVFISVYAVVASHWSAWLAAIAGENSKE